MSKHGKNFENAIKKLEADKIYGPKQALDLVKEMKFAKFDETVEVHIRTSLDPRQADQQIRDVCVLPKGLGKTVRVLVFAQGEAATAARAAGGSVRVRRRGEGGQRMNAEFMEALNALAVEKGISTDTLLAALADALESAYKRMPGAHEYAWVVIDPDSAEIVFPKGHEGDAALVVPAAAASVVVTS